jgi:hypothetical protein
LQGVEESLRISGKENKFQYGAAMKYFLPRWARETPVTQGFPGPCPHYEDKSLLLRKNSCAAIEGSPQTKNTVASGPSRRAAKLVQQIPGEQIFLTQ